MDLQTLEAELGELEARFREYNTAAESDYNPREAILPLLNEVFAAYIEASDEDRRAIRDVMSRPICASAALLEYILECAECLETPDDADAFYMGLVAASIENYAHDFRDTSACLAELAMAAVQAQIDIEPISTAVAALSSAEKSRGGVIPMRRTLEQFHVYAPTAVRLF